MQELERLLRLITTSDQGAALYAVVALAAAIDAFPSLIPSQTILITAAVLSARPDGPSIWLLLVAGACGGRGIPSRGADDPAGDGDIGGGAQVRDGGGRFLGSDDLAVNLGQACP